MSGRVFTENSNYHPDLVFTEGVNGGPPDIHPFYRRNHETYKSVEDFYDAYPPVPGYNSNNIEKYLQGIGLLLGLLLINKKK